VKCGCLQSIKDERDFVSRLRNKAHPDIQVYFDFELIGYDAAIQILEDEQKTKTNQGG
jgi:hypothetical protein